MAAIWPVRFLLRFPKRAEMGSSATVRQHSSVYGPRGGPGGGARCMQCAIRSDEEKAALMARLRQGRTRAARGSGG